jgi:hypothetical protein
MAETEVGTLTTISLADAIAEGILNSEKFVIVAPTEVGTIKEVLTKEIEKILELAVRLVQKENI